MSKLLSKIVKNKNCIGLRRTEKTEGLKLYIIEASNFYFTFLTISSLKVRLLFILNWLSWSHDSIEWYRDSASKYKIYLGFVRLWLRRPQQRKLTHYSCSVRCCCLKWDVSVVSYFPELFYFLDSTLDYVYTYTFLQWKTKGCSINHIYHGLYFEVLLLLFIKERRIVTTTKKKYRRRRRRGFFLENL